MSKLINNWIELAEVPESETHKLQIDWVGDIRATGWIVDKVTNKFEHYLSTHTFYGNSFKDYTKLLNEHGFDIELKNWDEK